MTRILILAALLSTDANAIDYATIGAGVGELYQPNGRAWWWQQPCCSHTEAERSASVSFGLGWNIGSNYAAETTARYYGNYSGYLLFQEPEKTTDDPTTACYDPCKPKYAGYNWGEVYGATAEVVRRWKYGHVSVGANLFRAHWRHYRNDPAAPVNERYSVVVNQTHTGIGGIIGFGVGLGAWSIDYRIAPEVTADNPCCSPWRTAQTVQIVYRAR